MAGVDWDDEGLRKALGWHWDLPPRGASFATEGPRTEAAADGPELDDEQNERPMPHELSTAIAQMEAHLGARLDRLERIMEKPADGVGASAALATALERIEERLTAIEERVAADGEMSRRPRPDPDLPHRRAELSSWRRRLTS